MSPETTVDKIHFRYQKKKKILNMFFFKMTLNILENMTAHFLSCFRVITWSRAETLLGWLHYFFSLSNIQQKTNHSTWIRLTFSCQSYKAIKSCVYTCGFYFIVATSGKLHIIPGCVSVQVFTAKKKKKRKHCRKKRENNLVGCVFQTFKNINTK